MECHCRSSAAPECSTMRIARYLKESLFCFSAPARRSQNPYCKHPGDPHPARCSVQVPTYLNFNWRHHEGYMIQEIAVVGGLSEKIRHSWRENRRAATIPYHRYILHSPNTWKAVIFLHPHSPQRGNSPICVSTSKSPIGHTPVSLIRYQMRTRLDDTSLTRTGQWQFWRNNQGTYTKPQGPASNSNNNKKKVQAHTGSHPPALVSWAPPRWKRTLGPH